MPRWPASIIIRPRINSSAHDLGTTRIVPARASSVTDFRHDSRYDHSRVDGGVSHLRRGVNGVVEVRPFTGVMVQAGSKLVTVTTNYEAVLEDGSTLYGTTFYPHYLPQQTVVLPGMQLPPILSVHQDFDGRRLWVRTTSEVAPLARRTADAASVGVATTMSSV